MKKLITLCVILLLFTTTQSLQAGCGNVVYFSSGETISGDGGDSNGGNNGDNEANSSDDLTIKSCKVKIDNETSYQHSISKTLGVNDYFVIDAEARVKNKSNYDSYDTDIDYRIDHHRDKFDSNDTKLAQDTVDIPAGDTITKHMGKTTVKVSNDGKTITVSKGDHHETFNVINGIATFYIFLDIENRGDEDISSETNHDEYAKVTVIVSQPDLIVSGLSTGRVVQNGNVQINYSIKNITETGIRNKKVCTSIRLLNSNSLKRQETYCDSVSLTKNKIKYYTVSMSMPYSPGTYTLRATVDNTQNINELNENNNIRDVSMTIDAPPIGQLVSTMRFYNKRTHSHLYSTRASDIASLPRKWPDWQYHGKSFKAFTKQRPGTVPVYACWSKYNTHKYSRSWSYAKKECTQNPWIAFYEYPNQKPNTKPVRQLWHPRLQVYIYSNGEADANNLVRYHGFERHGIVWYAPN